MTRVALLASVAAVAAVAGVDLCQAETARPSTHGVGDAHRAIAALPGSVTLYDQNNEVNGVAVISSDDDDVWSAYSSSGADDFLVPQGHKWKVQQVEVTGIYVNGSGPAYSENIAFYKDKHGLPGKLMAHCDEVLGKDNGGSFAIRLPKPCQVTLKGGATYWISVVANLTWNEFGIWEWETRDSQNGNAAAWENPGGGFERCPNWAVMTSCIGNYGEGPDFMFTLKGKDILQ